MAQGIEVRVRGQRARPAPALAAEAGGVGSVYIHIPFCSHKCHYCDFYSFVDTRDRQARFVDALIAELGMLAPCARPLETVFVGGGTPSLLAVDLWARLLDALHDRFTLAGDAEFTVECNPESVSSELMTTLAGGGVNRVSVGAQSFDGRHLRTLERWHDPANVHRALALAAEAGIERRSIDLIFGIPGQTLDDWERDLAIALGLPIDHLSCYALTYEPGTAMTARLARGEFDAADEDVEAEMYEATVRTLGDAGLSRYEVSNFAMGDETTPGVPGSASRHNLVYWRGGEWLAAGPSASGHVGGWRWKNVPHLGDWMEGVERGERVAVDVEEPDGRRAL